MHLPSLLVLAVALLCSPAVGQRRTLKLMVFDLQPLQPYGDWKTPCVNVSEPSCRAGLAAGNAIMRHNSGGADMVLKVGAVNGVSKFVSMHPRFLEINFQLYKSMGFDLLMLTTSAIATMSKLWEGMYDIYEGKPHVVSTNFKLDSAYLRSVMDFVHIEQWGDVKVAYLAMFPTQYKNIGAPIEFSLNYISILRKVFKVTHVVVWITLDWDGVDEDVSRYTESEEVDVVLFRSQPLAGEPSGSPVAPRKVKKTWQVDLFPLYPRVDEVVLEMDGGEITGVRAVAHSTEKLPASYRDATFERDSQTIQALIDESLAADEVLGISTHDMPYSYKKFDNGTEDAPCRWKECELGTLTTEAMLYSASLGGDISILNGGNQFDGWPAGPVRISHLAKTQPYNDYLCYLNMSAVEIWRALEYSVSTVTSEGAFNPKADVNEQYLQVQGVKYRYNPRHPPGSRITGIETRETGEWRPINTKRPYQVIATSWLCSGGDGFNLRPFPGTQPVWSMAEDESTITADYLRKNTPYTPHVNGLITSNFDEEPLRLAKTAEDCDKYSQYLAMWEVCDPCPEGTWNPSRGEGPCISIPVSSPSSVDLPLVLGVTGGLLVVVAAVGYWVTTRKQRRIRQLYNSNRIAEDCAEAVASMHLEELDYLLDLEKPNRVQAAFITIVSTLKTYREYMPQSVLQDDDESECESMLHGKRGINTEMSTVRSSTAHSEAAAGKLQHLQTGLKKKTMSVLVVNMRNFRVAVKKDTSEIEASHQAYLQAVLNAAHSGKGVAEPFCGDRIAILWNGPKPCVGHTENASAAACALRTTLSETWQVDIGVAAGPCYAGNIGVDGMKKFCVLGQVYTNAWLLMMAGKRYGPAVLIDDMLAERLTGKYRVVFQDRLLNEKLDKGLNIWSMLAAVMLQEEEWMYQLAANDEESQGMKKLNEAWLLFVREGAQGVRLPTQPPDTPEEKASLERLQSLITKDIEKDYYADPLSLTACY